MNGLGLYAGMSRFGFMNYRAKIMAIAFAGTHVPLIALIVYFAAQASLDRTGFAVTLGVALVATLLGTGATLLALDALLRPVINTSKALRAYRDSRTLSDLPSRFRDEVGTLMADAGSTIEHLEAVRDLLEHFDPATGLMNRKRLLRELEGRAAQGAGFSIVVVRFPNLLRVKQAFDAKTIETAMKLLAERVARALPPGTPLARVGQIELAGVLSDDGAGLAERLRAACGGDLGLDGLTLRPELLCGLSTFPTDARRMVELLDHAIAAASMATVASPTVHHSSEARARSAERLRLEQALRAALERNELELHFQPVVDLAAGRVTAAEALVRWNHPEKGLLLPGAFIGVAESSGLIDPLGLWVLGEACREAQAWSRSGRPDLKVAVNLSARQFADRDLKRHVAEAIGAAGIEPSQLEIELTETAAMTNHEHTRRTFAMLREQGVTIAIDDFGTGYASLSQLLKLPFDKLKIDREFVTRVYDNRDAQAICSALITLSRGLGLDVLAEGAETREEVAFLARLGCDLFQGHVFSPSVPGEAFLTTVAEIDRTALLGELTRPKSRERVHAAE